MNITALYWTIVYLSAGSVLVPIVCCLPRFNAFNAELKALFFYFIISLLFDVAGYIRVTHGFGNYITENIYTVLECSVIIYIYSQRFKTDKARRRILPIYFAFVLLAFCVFIINNKYNKQDNIVSTVEAAFIIGLAYAYFYKEMQELSVAKLHDYYFSWINSAFLIYFSMTIFLFLFDAYIEKMEAPMYYFIFTLHLLSNIASNIIMAIGVCKYKKT